MLFKKNKQQDHKEDALRDVRLALTSLVPLCNEGLVRGDAFVIQDKNICIYADVVSLKDNVAQIVYQLHHDFLDEPIMESVAASGEDLDDAIHMAASSFYANVLSLYIQALEHPTSAKRIRIMNEEPHDYFVYRGCVNGVGKREGVLEGDFWDMLQEDILSCLSNKKAHWIKVFASKNRNNVICEVRINNMEISTLSEKMIRYAEDWNCIDNYHTEKQGILLLQDTSSYVEAEYKKEDIERFCEQAISLYEQVTTREEYLDIRQQLFQLCKDKSLTHEIFFLIPELYCIHAYPEVEFGDVLYLIRKGEATKEIKQTQLYSFPYIQQCVAKHIHQHAPSKECMDRVLRFSANAKAIQKAVDEGNQLDELLISGMGILIPQDYKQR